jgi:hypothetical protein
MSPHMLRQERVREETSAARRDAGRDKVAVRRTQTSFARSSPCSAASRRARRSKDAPVLARRGGDAMTRLGAEGVGGSARLGSTGVLSEIACAEANTLRFRVFLRRRPTGLPQVKAYAGAPWGALEPFEPSTMAASSPKPMS